MSKIKCVACGLVNWANAENCIRCSAKLDCSSSSSINYPEQSISNNTEFDSASANSVRPFLIVGIFLLLILFCSYKYVTESPSVPSGGKTAVSKDSASKTNKTPPTQWNIPPPTMEDALVYGKPAILAQNKFRVGDIAIAKSMQDTTKVIDKASIENGMREIADLKARFEAQVPQCWDQQCQKSRESRINDLFHEHELAQSDQYNQTHPYCLPQIQGEIKFKGGSYKELANVYFYFGEVSAAGLTATEKDGECGLKNSWELTAKVYLKWVPGVSGWQQSNENELAQFAEKQDKIYEEKIQKEKDARELERQNRQK